MAAEHKGADILDRHLEFLRQEIAQPRAVEHPGHADDAVRREAGRLLHDPHHSVERVRDRDDESLRAMLLDRRPDLADHLCVDADQIVAAHARLPRHPGRDDDDIRALDARIIVRAGDRGVVALDRRSLHDVERLSLRHAFDNVEQHDIAQFLEAGQEGQRAADLAGADQRDLVACHREILVIRVCQGGQGMARVLPRIPGPGKAAPAVNSDGD